MVALAGSTVKTLKTMQTKARWKRQVRLRSSNPGHCHILDEAVLDVGRREIGGRGARAYAGTWTG
jgi:hypothetical protein